MCGDRIMPQAFCPSCGHSLCKECKRLASAHAPVFMATPEAHQEPLAAEAPPANMVDIGSVKTEPARAKESSLKNVQREQALKRGAETQNAKRSSVKNNPFVIADQIAKAKVAEPQSSNTHILAAPPSIPPKYAMVRQDKGINTADYHSREDGQHPIISVAGLTRSNMLKHQAPNATLDAIVSETTVSSLSTLSHPPFEIREYQQHEGWSPEKHSTRKPSESTTTGNLSPGAWVAENFMERTPSPIMRRFKVLACQPSSGILERALEVEVEEGGRHVPKVRVASPPPWLKNPTHTPGKIEGRLRRVVSRGGPYLSRQQDTEETSQFRAWTPPASVESRTISMGEQPKQNMEEKPQSGLPMGGTSKGHLKPFQSEKTVSAATLMDQTSPRGTVQLPSLSEVATATVSEIRIQPKPAAPTIARQRSLWKIQQHTDPASEMRRSKVGTSYTAAGELGTEAETEVGENRTESVIVLHLRGKDDLVISTDLTRDS